MPPCAWSHADAIPTLAAIFGRAVAQRGRTFTEYGDSHRWKVLPVNCAELEASAELLNELHDLTEALAFKSSDIRAALKMVSSEWALAPQTQSKYEDSMTKRLQNMLHKVHDGEKRTPLAMWVRALPWRRGAIADETACDGMASPATVAKDDESEVAYVF